MPSMQTISLTPISSRTDMTVMVRSYACSGLGAISDVTTTRSRAFTLLGFGAASFSAAPSSAEISSVFAFLLRFGLGTAPA